MTAEELKTKRLSLGFRSRNALAKALGISKYAVEYWEYGRRAIPGWVPHFLK
jgi:DNA-binding transcriptional regulator YiaG